MNKDFLVLVHKIKADHGNAVLTDVRRLRSLLADYASTHYEGERRQFILALEVGLVARLLKEEHVTEAFLKTQTSYFSSKYFLREEVAQFIVWGWAEVLDLQIGGQAVLLAHAPGKAPSSPPSKSQAPQTPPNPVPPSVSVKKTLWRAHWKKMLSAGIVSFLLILSLVVFRSCQALSPAAEKTYNNTIGMEFVLIPAGSFRMGCDETDKNCDKDESPQHPVKISKAFYLGKYEVTQAQWKAVMGNNPSHFKGDNLPVDSVSWDDAKEFIKKLNQKEGTGKYRLPAEAEWEYAARAGSQTAYSFGSDASPLGKYAWYWENSQIKG